MGVTNYGTSSDSLASPSLSSWAASVATALDSSDTTVNTRITQRKLPIAAKTGNYTLTTSDEVVTCNGTLTITLPTAVGADGKQYVIRNIATNTVTIARTSSQTIDGCSGTITLAGKGVMTVVSDGANWLVVAAQYTDESVGRRIFTWSSALASGATTGWQMTYGDTGWRTITPENGWTATGFVVRRQNSLVTVNTYNLSGAAKTSNTFWTVPAGFKESNGQVVYQVVTGGTVIHDSSAGTMVSTATGALYVNMTYSVTTAWPSSLPGSASGSVPAS